jgi:hypothetical protein
MTKCKIKIFHLFKWYERSLGKIKSLEKFFAPNERIIGDRDDMSASVTLRISESIELFFVDILYSGFFLENAIKVLFKGYPTVDDTTGNHVFSLLGFSRIDDEYDTKFVFIDGKNNNIERSDRNREIENIWSMRHRKKCRKYKSIVRKRQRNASFCLKQERMLSYQYIS